MAADLQSRVELSAGYVFVLSCPETPGSVKIGSSTIEPGPYRSEPFGTIEPIPCKVEFSVHVPDRHEVERNLTLKLAARRIAQDRNRFATTPEEAVAAAVQLIGYDYTNAQITGVIFRKQVDVLKKLEADFRSRNKSFSILNGELADMQKTLRRCRRELEEKTAMTARQAQDIADLQAESAALAARCRRARLSVFAAGGVAALAVAFTAASLFNLV